MKRIITALVALAVTVGLGTAPAVLLASTAEAAKATPGCITKAEFRAVKKGTSLKKARRIIGARGKVTDTYYYYSSDNVDRTVDFRQCGKRWNESLVFFNTEKTEYEDWVSDTYCYDYGIDYYGCEDVGGYESFYQSPVIVYDKYADWSFGR